MSKTNYQSWTLCKRITLIYLVSMSECTDCCESTGIDCFQSEICLCDWTLRVRTGLLCKSSINQHSIYLKICLDVHDIGRGYSWSSKDEFRCGPLTFSSFTTIRHRYFHFLHKISKHNTETSQQHWQDVFRISIFAISQFLDYFLTCDRSSKVG